MTSLRSTTLDYSEEDVDETLEGLGELELVSKSTEQKPTDEEMTRKDLENVLLDCFST